MPETHQEPNYMTVFYSLAVLTAVEIGVAYMRFLPLLVMGFMLIVLALAKAALVGMYFMHLKFEKRTLGIIAMTPLILCTLLIIALLPDLTGTNRKSEKVAAVQVETADASPAADSN
ncbi:cytochrome C oxidase subunit IV family protein [candidate division KSB1 bacterium]|nr:cytochrome C oxidase subunit IV family protein [candidate division KSB1 bacterium]